MEVFQMCNGKMKVDVFTQREQWTHSSYKELILLFSPGLHFNTLIGTVDFISLYFTFRRPMIHSTCMHTRARSCVVSTTYLIS